MEQYGIETLIIGGGVSANKKIRADFTELTKELSIELMIPEISASTDNAFMIALQAICRCFRVKNRPLSSVHRAT